MDNKEPFDTTPFSEAQSAEPKEPVSPADAGGPADQPAEQSAALPEPPADEGVAAAEGVEAQEPEGFQPEPLPPPATGLGPSESEAVAGAAHEFKWYVVQVYSGYEQKARASLLERIKQAGIESNFGEILIPMETVQEGRSGGKRVSAKTFYPGYIFVEMEMSDEVWHVVRDTPKVTGFVGGRHPRAVPPQEVRSVVQQVEEGAAKPRPQVVFEQGDHVRVTGGAFANFTGSVEEVKPEKQKVKVLVSIFGRATPVELDYSQVERTS